MMPTRNSDSPSDLYLTGREKEDTDTGSIRQVTENEHYQKIVLSHVDPLAVRHPRPTSISLSVPKYSSSNNNQSLSDKTDMNRESTNFFNSENNLVDEESRPTSGRGSDPPLNLHFPLETSYISETPDEEDDDDDGASIILPSPERIYGSRLGTASPAAREIRDSGDNATAYVTCLESLERRAESPGTYSPRKNMIAAWDIQRRITFSQDSQQSAGTPAETRESIAGFARQQMSPEKSLKRGPHSYASEETNSKKRRENSLSTSPGPFDLRSPFRASSANFKSSERLCESPHVGKSLLVFPKPLTLFRDRINSQTLPTPPPTESNTEMRFSPTFNSRKQRDSNQETEEPWHLQLSETQNSEIQPTSLASRSVISRDHVPTSNGEDDSPTLLLESQGSLGKDLPTEEDPEPMVIGTSSRLDRLVDRIRSDSYAEKRTSTPVDGSPIDGPSGFSKATFRVQPPAVLQVSGASTITPSTPPILPARHQGSSVFARINQQVSTVLSEQPQKEKPQVESTAASILLQSSSCSSDSNAGFSLEESSLGLHNSNINSSLFHQSTDLQNTSELNNSVGFNHLLPDLLHPREKNPTPDDQTQQKKADEHVTEKPSTPMHLERGLENQTQPAVASEAVTPHNVPNSAAKSLFSPEVGCGIPSRSGQQKRLHSDEEQVRSVRSMQDCSIQTDSSFDTSAEQEERHVDATSKGDPAKGKQNSSSSGSSPEDSVLCRIRDITYRYKEWLSRDGLITKSKLLDYQETVHKDIPENQQLPHDTNRLWNSLTSEEPVEDDSMFTRPLVPEKQTAVSKEPSNVAATTSTSTDDQELVEDAEAPLKTTPFKLTPRSKTPLRSQKKGLKKKKSPARVRPIGRPRKKTKTSSPDFPVAAKPETPLASPVTSPSTGTFSKDMPIMARWPDGYYYPATVTDLDPTGKWLVNFEDGSQHLVRESDMLEEALMRKGQSVMAKGPKENCYEAGIIQGRYTEDDHCGFIVELDSGMTLRCKRSEVILSTDQAADLVSRKSPEHSVASLSLDGRQVRKLNRRFKATDNTREDNIVEGKRRRTPKAFSDSSPVTTPRTIPTRGLGDKPQPSLRLREGKPDPNIQSSDYNSTLEGADESQSRIPRLKTTSSRKKIERTDNSDDEMDEDDQDKEKLPSKELASLSITGGRRATPKKNSSKKSSPRSGKKKKGFGRNTPSKNSDTVPPAPPAIIRSPKVFRNPFVDCSATVPLLPSSVLKSPKVVRNLFVDCTSTETENDIGILPKSPDIFKGLYFLISCADRSAQQSQSDSEVSLDGSLERIPFLDREHVTRQLQLGGGVVLDSFEDTQSLPKKQVILISNTHLRTLKYIKCLATGIPCVSVTWVNCCCEKGKKLPWVEYMLPAGHSLLDDQVVDRTNTTALQDLHVMVFSEKNPQFAPFWTPVLLAAQASTVHRPLETRLSIKNSLVHVVVTDPSCPEHMLKKFRQLKTPVVSSEWVIQCIITGKRLRHNAHPKFKHTYSVD